MFLGNYNNLSLYLGDVSEVEQIVNLGRSGKKLCSNSVVQLQCSLSQCVSNGLHLLLEALQLLIDHGAVDPSDLGLLH